VLRNRRDAERLMAVLPRRFARYGLTLHPDKTRLLRFKPAADARERESFQFLGFTHVWGRSRRGRWVIKRKTAKDRCRRTLKRVSQWCRKHRHRPIPEQYAHLSAALRGILPILVSVATRRHCAVCDIKPNGFGSSGYDDVRNATGYRGTALRNFSSTSRCRWRGWRRTLRLP